MKVNSEISRVITEDLNDMNIRQFTEPATFIEKN